MGGGRGGVSIYKHEMGREMGEKGGGGSGQYLQIRAGEGILLFRCKDGGGVMG